MIPWRISYLVQDGAASFERHATIVIAERKDTALGAFVLAKKGQPLGLVSVERATDIEERAAMGVAAVVGEAKARAKEMRWCSAVCPDSDFDGVTPHCMLDADHDGMHESQHGHLWAGVTK